MLIDCSFGTVSVPSGARASSSKKQVIRSPEERKSSSLTRTWSLVVNTVRWDEGSKASTISSARSRAAAQASARANPSSTRKPSRWKSATWPSDTIRPM